MLIMLFRLMRESSSWASMMYEVLIPLKCFVTGLTAKAAYLQMDMSYMSF